MIKKIESFELSGQSVQLLTDGTKWGIVSSNRKGIRLFDNAIEATDALEQEILAIKGVCTGPQAECLTCDKCS